MTISRRGRAKTAKKVQKSFMHVQSCCFALQVFGTIHSSPLWEVANSTGTIIILVSPIKFQLRENHVPKKPYILVM